jgi:hypothetical protein
MSEELIRELCRIHGHIYEVGAIAPILDGCNRQAISWSAGIEGAQHSILLEGKADKRLWRIGVKRRAR